MTKSVIRIALDHWEIINTVYKLEKLAQINRNLRKKNEVESVSLSYLHANSYVINIAKVLLEQNKTKNRTLKFW